MIASYLDDDNTFRYSDFIAEVSSRLMGLSGDRQSSAKLIKLDICLVEARFEWWDAVETDNSLSFSRASRDVQNERQADRQCLIIFPS